MTRDNDLDKELRFHIDERTDDLIASGVAADEARRQARLEFGGMMQTKEAVRDLGLWPIVNGLVQDLRFAMRTLRATPIVTFVAVLSLALGIGANTAMFSLVNSLLLRTLPVRDPARLALMTDGTAPHIRVWNYPIWEEIRRRPQLFDGAVAWSPMRINLAGGGETQPVEGLIASGSFFDTLGVSAFRGRTFSEADDRRGGGGDGPVVVLSYAFWQSRFGGAADAVGQTLRLDGVPFTIIGVAPPEFHGPDVGRDFDTIVPIGAEPLMSRRESLLNNPSATWLNIIARLRSDRTIETTQAALRAEQAHIFDVTRPPWNGTAALEQYLKQQFTVVPAATGDSTLRERYQRPLLTILAVVGLVLLVACANIANLLMARATARRHELSVRRALGASRWRLTRQLLTESAILAATGSAIGLLLASWGSRLLVAQMSTPARAIVLDLSLDRRVLVFTIAVTAITALLFGVVPALLGSGVAPMDALKERGNNAQQTVHGGRWSGGLVIAQIALSLVLVVGAGLFGRTFFALSSRGLGFDRDRVLIASINAHSASIDVARRLRIYGEARDAVRALPGVADAALSAQTPPIDGATMILGLRQVSGGPLLIERPLEQRLGILGFVGPGFFNTLGTPILAGRDFTAGDVKGTPLVAVVNQAFARAYLDGQSPVGHSLQSSMPALTMEIVGVTADAVYRSVRAPVQPVIYIPLAQATWAPTPMTAQLDLSVRAASGTPESLSRSVGSAVRAINSHLVINMVTLSDQVNASLTQERIVAMLSAFFGALALLLASLGLYGVTAYSVARRRAEIGIRMALGASQAGVVRLVLSHVTKLVTIGVIVGAGLSLWTSTLVATLLYGLEPRDPITLTAAAIVLALIGAIAGWLPARNASRIDPAEVLRDA